MNGGKIDDKYKDKALLSSGEKIHDLMVKENEVLFQILQNSRRFFSDTMECDKTMLGVYGFNSYTDYKNRPIKEQKKNHA